MSQNNADSIAIFPIPNVVAFPGHRIQLHIFEPRYRKMIQDCLENKKQLGIALPERVIGGVRKPKSMDEMLQSNQTSFEPKTILGAGEVYLTDTLNDGRLMVEIVSRRKVRIRRFEQKVPYYVAAIETLEDRVEDPATARNLFDDLLKTSKRILGEHYQAVSSGYDANMLVEYDLGELVSETMKWFVFDADLRQSVLEETVIESKANFILQIMMQYLKQIGEDDLILSSDPDNAKVIHVDFSKGKRDA